MASTSSSGSRQLGGAAQVRAKLRVRGLLSDLGLPDQCVRGDPQRGAGHPSLSSSGPAAASTRRRSSSISAPARTAHNTYIFTMTGWAYLATVIDGFSRKVVAVSPSALLYIRKKRS